MSYFEAKSLIALLFMGAAVTAVVSMLTLMGRSERKLSILGLRATHRTAGYVFAGLLVVAAIMGLRYLAAAGDGLALRGVIHWVLATFLVVVLGLKIVIVRYYKQFLKFVPVFGLIVFCLAFVVAVVSAVFFLVARGPAAAGDARVVPAEQQSSEATILTAGDPNRGEGLFGRHCAFCHHAESEESKIGPGLAGVLSGDVLSSSRIPATSESVRAQLMDPAGTMPSFAGVLSDQDLDHLIAYLRTL